MMVKVKGVQRISHEIAFVTDAAFDRLGRAFFSSSPARRKTKRTVCARVSREHDARARDYARTPSSVRHFLVGRRPAR